MRRHRGSTPLVAIVAAWATACSTLTQSDLAKRTDYLPAMAAHESGKPGDAHALLPHKEPGGFITTLESGWLSLLAGNPDPEPLVEVGNALEERKTLSVRRETKAYFYKETEDGYYPAEHEAIILHVVAGLSFAAQGRMAQAKIEARKASFYLQSDFGSGIGFDDPALRLWLAGLWAATGEWDNARVDLRAASKLPGGKSALISALAKQKKPPPFLSLVFVGSGPDVTWEPKKSGRLDAIAFVPGAEAPAHFPENSIDSVGLPTAPWYRRHQERDQEIRQVLNQSRYMVEGLPAAGAAAATMSAGVVAGTAVMIVGVAAGVGIVVLGAKAAIAIDAGELSAWVFLMGLAGGGAAASFGISTGSDMIDSSAETSGELLEQGYSPIDSYRYVRFLPDHVYMMRSKTAAITPIGPSGLASTPFLKVGGGKTTEVSFFYGTGSEREQSRSLEAMAWSDGRGRHWSLFPNPRSADPARMDCKSLSRMNGIKYRLPSWEEILDAEKNGMFDQRRSPLAVGLYAKKEVWTASQGGDDPPGHCRYLILKDMSEMPTTDCWTERGVICVGQKPKKK